MPGLVIYNITKYPSYKIGNSKINNSLFFNNLQEVKGITLKIIKLGRKRYFFG